MRQPEGERSDALFYPLHVEEWVQAVHELTESQKDVLYYLRSLDPFGNQDLELGVREIARILRYDPGTISRALNTLHKKGYINLEMLRVRVRINPGGVLHQNNTVAAEQQSRSQCNTDGAETTTVAPEQQPLHQNNNRRFKPSQGKGSKSSRSLRSDQIDQDLSQTAHPPTGEREEIDEETLIAFVISKNPGKRSPRAYAKKCLKNDRQHWEGEYRAYQQALQQNQERLQGTTLPPPAAEPQKNSAPDELTPEMRFSKYRQLWQVPTCRKGVQKAIRAHPEWGLAIQNEEVVQVQQGGQGGRSP